jgi:hypothetical protein
MKHLAAIECSDRASSPCEGEVSSYNEDEADRDDWLDRFRAWLPGGRIH